MTLKQICILETSLCVDHSVQRIRGGKTEGGEMVFLTVVQASSAKWLGVGIVVV